MWCYCCHVFIYARYAIGMHLITAVFFSPNVILPVTIYTFNDNSDHIGSL